jgi:hypothetical protein
MTRTELGKGLRLKAAARQLQNVQKDFHYRDNEGVYNAILTIHSSGGLEYSRVWRIAGPRDLVYVTPDTPTIEALNAMHTAATQTAMPRSVGSPFGYEPEDKVLIGDQEET